MAALLKPLGLLCGVLSRVGVSVVDGYRRTAFRVRWVARTNVGVILCGAFGGLVNSIGMFADGRSAAAMATMTATAIDVGWGAMIRRGGFY